MSDTRTFEVSLSVWCVRARGELCGGAPRVGFA